MKTFISSVFLACAVFLSGCDEHDVKDISGVLTINPQAGYDSFEFVDIDSDQIFRMPPGRYTVEFDQRIFTQHRLEIYDEHHVLLGKMGVPHKNIQDDGSFAILAGKDRNGNAFNILGGLRKKILSKVRYEKLRQYCTYTVTYPCTKTNSKGETESDTCTKTVSGDRDEVWEEMKYQNVFRILMDAYDFYNAGVFTGEGPELVTNQMLDAEACD